MSTHVRKAPRGYTYDVCPGCGCTPPAVSPRPSKGVCRECREALEHHKRQIEESTPDQREYLLYRVPSQSHWLPYIHHDPNDRSIQKAFHAALLAFTHRPDLPSSLKPATVRVMTGRNDDQVWNKPLVVPDTRRSDSGHTYDAERPMTPAQAEAMTALFEAIRAGLEAVYRAGVDRGRNLLVQLNDGTLSTSKFEESLRYELGEPE